ncbi:MAG: NAD(P)H-dependent flavin oxidoreductase [Paracoccaceae bacterium]
MPNTFCNSFGLSIPIVQAPMGGATPPELVAAVSNAGGLGLAPLWTHSPDGLRDFVRQVKTLTDRPFGVNLNMDFPNAEQLDVCLEEGVPVISIFWQMSETFIRRAKAGGAQVIFSAWDAASAVEAVSYGADAICAQGWEAGGHVRGDVSTMALVPAVVDAVGDVPVIAAGGIADGRGLAAAMALGAQAAWIGTRFLAAEEADIHPDYVARLIAANETSTGHYADLFDVTWPDAPHRVLQNSTTRAWEVAGRPPTGQRPGEGEVILRSPQGSDVVRYQSSTPKPDMEGSVEASSMWAGQGLAQVRKVQPAAEIVQEIAEEARRIIPF